MSPALAAASMSEGSASNTANGPSPAGMHRGSINGIPGGGLPGAQNMSRSPIKEQSSLAKSASADDHAMSAQIQEAQNNLNAEMSDGTISPPPKTEGIPIRR